MLSGVLGGLGPHAPHGADPSGRFSDRLAFPSGSLPSPLLDSSTPCPDSNSEETLPASVKNKYEAMDFDSLLKEAQQSLH